MAFEIELVTPAIVLLRFSSMVSMCRTMMRFAEHFESPRFRGEVFTRAEFKEWYAADRGGAFTYYRDWGGYNVPSTAFRAFAEGRFDPLTPSERAVMAAVKGLPRRFYMIATEAGKTGFDHAFRHEMAHAFYHASAAYRANVGRILRPLPDKARPEEEIRRSGYHPDVLRDELHAYLVDGVAALKCITRRRYGAKGVAAYERASARLNENLTRFMPRQWRP